jgi:iron complex transport system substrate-binding protein
VSAASGELASPDAAARNRNSAVHTVVVRIVSLLPSATEIVYALGLENDLVGVTHECDWPPGAVTKRVVSTSALPHTAAPAEIDAVVSASVATGTPIYRLDADAVRELRPDIVLTQDLCAVCAVPSGHVNEALEIIGCKAEVVSLDPRSLDEVIDCISAVGRVTRTEERAEALSEELRARSRTVADAVAGLQRPRVFALEWADPPFNGGHWVPGMITLAGGECVLGNAGLPSVRVGWDEIAQVAPEVVVFMPCGYGLDEAVSQGAALLERSELEFVSAIYAVDATSYFSRPGPRLVDGVELLANALHPGSVTPTVDGGIERLR